jgi:hypothetical protein
VNPPQRPQRPVWRKGHKIALAILGGAFGLVIIIVIIAAIASGGGQEEQPANEGGIPADFDAYLTDLDAIDPGIRAGREDQPVYNDANNTCLDIEQGTEDDVLLDHVMQRFGVNEAADIVTEDVARQILDVTREHCDMIRPE